MSQVQIPLIEDTDPFVISTKEPKKNKQQKAPIVVKEFLSTLNTLGTDAATQLIQKNLITPEIKEPTFNIDEEDNLYQLDFFPIHQEYQRVTANALSRSSLFTINPRDEENNRIYYREMTPIFTLQGCKIRYSGELLDQSDYDVFMAVVHLYKDRTKKQLPIAVQVTPLQLLKKSGMSSSGKDYKRLETILDRLHKCFVEITYQNNEKMQKISTPLISTLSQYKEDENSRIKKNIYQLTISHEIINMFVPGSYSRINWDKHLKLSSLAKFLHHFYQTHDSPFAYTTQTLMILTSTKTKSVPAFKQSLGRALNELVNLQIITNFYFRDGKLFIIKPSFKKAD